MSASDWAKKFEASILFASVPFSLFSLQSHGSVPLVLVVLNWVVALGCKDEISWDKLGALVKQLEERVLCVGSWFSEQNWAGSVVDVFTVTGDSLAVRLHRKLLEIGRETVHVLIESDVTLTSDTGYREQRELTVRRDVSGHRRSRSTTRSTDHQ
jgi:hypothetical protein